MQLKRIGTRGLLATFDDPYLTNVYIIASEARIFILDTFLGSDSMEQVKEVLRDEGLHDLPIIVFNSHADYDHFWGNYVLQPSFVIGHANCRKRILIESGQSLINHKDHMRGEVTIQPPDFTFLKRIIFPQDNIEFFYSPGHTLDSSSCYDTKDRVLFVGDNVESPIPYLNHPNFAQYIHTLRNYLEIDWSFMIAGHDSILTDSTLIKQNLSYISSFMKWDFDLDKMEHSELHRHIQYNLVTLKEELMRSIHRDSFIKHLTEVSRYET